MRNFLFSLFIILSVSACSQNLSNVGYTNASNQTFQEKMKTPGTAILDVRTPDEYHAGHIPNAALINFYDKNFAQQIDSLDKSKTYLVYCAKGGRSSQASAMMVQKGFKDVINLQNGFSQWNGKVEK